MAGNLMGRGGRGRSPFDEIMEVDEQDEVRYEYWEARRLGRALSYTEWRNFVGVIDKAKDNCRSVGYQVSDHFVEVNKMIELGKGGYRRVTDYHLTRIGCYLVTLNADASKPEVAAAKHYFAAMTRAAELGIPAEPIQRAATAPPSVDRPWSVRFKESYLPHLRDVQVNHPGCFTVVTTLVGQMLGMEDELIRHMLEPAPSDRPDVSIGKHWAIHRALAGRRPAEKFATLYLPNVEYEATVAVYPDSERGTFETWFHQVYLPEKFPNYLGNKKSFNQFGELPPASAADHVCLSLSGVNANLKPKLRKQLQRVGGFAPVGTMVPQLEDDQGTMFGMFGPES